MAESDIAAECEESPSEGDIENGFRLFYSKPVDAFFSSPWYAVLFVVFIYLLWLTFAVVYSGRDLKQDWLKVAYEEYFLIYHFGVLLAFLSIVWWRARTPGFIAWIKAGGYLQARSGDFDNEFVIHFGQYRKRLRSRENRALVFAVILGALIAYGVVSLLLTEPTADFWVMNFILFGSWLVIAYLVASVISAIYASARFVGGLSDHFKVVTLPRHQDGCAGLKPLGDYCFDMTLPIVILILALILIAVGGLIRGGVGEIGMPEIVGALVLVSVLGVPVVAMSFLWPLAKIHDEMARVRMKAEDSLAAKTAELEGMIGHFFYGMGELAQAEWAREELELLRTLAPDKARYPTWPFRPALLVTLYSPQMVAFLSLVVAAIGII